jgi:hypothetical protein
VLSGLNFQEVLEGDDPQLVKMRASQQILIRLKKFDEATRRAQQPTMSSGPPKYKIAAAAGGSAASSSWTGTK